jgi:hypothetical protein
MATKSPYWQQIKEEFSEEYQLFEQHVRTLTPDTATGMLAILLDKNVFDDPMELFERWPEVIQAATFHGWLCIDIYKLQINDNIKIASSVSERILAIVNVWIKEEKNNFDLITNNPFFL